MRMKNTISEALTPEEWLKQSVERPAVGKIQMAYDFNSQTRKEVPVLMLGAGEVGGKVEVVHAVTRHALAALALHTQPFGFTHDDVSALRHAAVSLSKLGTAHVNVLDSLATRIAALIRPLV